MQAKERRPVKLSEAGKTLKRLVFYYLFLIPANLLPCIGNFYNRFPARNFSTIYLLILCSCLILYYSYRVARPGGLKVMMKAISWMMLLLILLRGIKYSAFAEVGVLARYTWYLYYVPILLIPLFFFYISLFVSSSEEQNLPRKWYWMLAVSAILILAVLTNDFHQQAFRFQPGFANWDGDYSQAWLHHVCSVWEYSLYFISAAILVAKSRVVSCKKNAWIILLQFAIGIAIILLIVTGNMLKLACGNIIEFPEALCLMVAGMLECAMQLGLIPTNEGYNRLLRVSSVSLQITDRFGTPLYKSDAAADLTGEQLLTKDAVRIGGHPILHRMEIPGGFGFWQDDVTELDCLNEELEEARNRLSEESELTRLQNELKEKRAKIEQRTMVYDAIAKRTQSTSQEISRIALEARMSSDMAFKDRSRKYIMLLGAYIKRCANLMLISADSRIIEVSELGLSVAEVLRYLNLCGIPAELLNTAEGSIPAEAALTVFEAFQTLLKTNFSSMSGVFVNLSGHGGTIFKLTLENLRTFVPESVEKKLLDCGIRTTLEYEDNIAYICFAFPAGGDAA
jgi:hypothetical protein